MGYFLGKIITIETVSMKLPCKHWTGPEVNPDLTCTVDELLHHVFYLTRVFFIFGTIQAELIGRPRPINPLTNNQPDPA